FSSCPHLDYALDNIIIVHDSSVFVPDRLAYAAQAYLGSLSYDCYLPYPDRRPILRLQNSSANVISIAHQTDDPDVVRLLSLFDEASAAIDIVNSQGLLHLSDG